MTALNRPVLGWRCAWIGVLLSVILLPGCFGLSRGAPEQQYFILGAAAGVPRAESQDTDPLVVGVRLPQLADYLASPFVVMRRGANRIEFSSQDRWGEDLALGISRRLVGEMALLAPASRFDPVPWPPSTQMDRILQLQILRFEGVAPAGEGAATGEAHLLASWEILNPVGNAVLARGSTEIRTPGWRQGDFAGLVALLDAGIGELAKEIVEGMESGPAPGGATPTP